MHEVRDALPKAALNGRWLLSMLSGETFNQGMEG